MSEFTLVKPPLGIVPKSIHNRQRAIDIVDAMRRYLVEDKQIPHEWFWELKDLDLVKKGQ